MGPSIKLSDMSHDQTDDNTSEDFIVPQGKIAKQTEYVVTYKEI